MNFRSVALLLGTFVLGALTLVAVERLALEADAAPGCSASAGVKTRAEMVKALSDWLAQDHMFKSSADLPPWGPSDEAPKSGEFPFYPEAGVDREGYEQIRAQKLPVFCYVQGMESLACLTVNREGQVDKVGVQLFPG
jgi:hypothetical protein